MPEAEGVVARVTARVRAVLERDWLGSAGEAFRQTMKRISAHPEVREKIKEAPDLAWNVVKGATNQRHAKSEVDFATAENVRIEAELRRRTLESKARQEEATADRLESDARSAEVKELLARLELGDRMRELNVAPVWDDEGKLTIVRPPEDFDWESLQRALVKADEMALTLPPADEENVDHEEDLEE